MDGLYLIRHGRTQANENRQYCGSTDLPLTPQSLEELQSCRYEIPEGCIMYTSGMRRAQQTMQALFGVEDARVDTRFREIDFGDFELHTYEELKQRPDYQVWIGQDGAAIAPPGGESGAEFQARVLEGLEALMDEEGDAVLVTHGGVIAVMMQALFPQEQQNRYQWQPQPGEGYLIRHSRYERLVKHIKEPQAFKEIDH